MPCSYIEPPFAAVNDNTRLRTVDGKVVKHVRLCATCAGTIIRPCHRRYIRLVITPRSEPVVPQHAAQARQGRTAPNQASCGG